MTPIADAIHWYLAAPSFQIAPQFICSTRDIFQARLDTFYREISLNGSLPEEEIALVVAVCGEIGNNCFDHNLGQWNDQIGCWFSWFEDQESNNIATVIADRGQGVLNSLKRVKPDLKNEQEALGIAFEKRLSGRSPEHRGNGLKFVRSVINRNPGRGLLFFSGSASMTFGGNQSIEKSFDRRRMTAKQETGTFALVLWSLA